MHLSAPDGNTTFFIKDSYPKFSIFWRGATGLVNFMGAKTPKIAFFCQKFSSRFFGEDCHGSQVGLLKCQKLGLVLIWESPKNAIEWAAIDSIGQTVKKLGQNQFVEAKLTFTKDENC